MKSKTKTHRRAKKVIEEAAEAAATEALEALEPDFEVDPFEDRPDFRDMADADEAHQQSSPEELTGKDIFRDAWTKANAKGDAPNFYIYKNGQWIANKPVGYSWEKLQKEFGEGHYRIVAKSSINGQNIMIQSQLVGNPLSELDNAPDDEPETQSKTPDPFAFLTAMSQVQERAETKASQLAGQQTAMITTMMQTVMQSQAQAQQQFQMMMLEMQKQNQMMAAENTKLLMTMLTQRPQKDESSSGMKMTEILKLMQDAEKNAESRTKTMYELVDKKAEQLAEIKAEALAGSSESEESLGKTLAKGFFPVLTQILAGQNGQPGARPAGPQLMNPSMPTMQGPLDKIPAASSGPVSVTGPAHVATPLQSAAKAQETRGVDPGKLHQERKAKREAQAQAREMASRPTNAQIREMERTKEQQVRFRKQLEVLDLVGVDIVQALVDRVPAKDVTESILNKLENSGTSRQTVAKLFALHDFFNHARRLGVPEEADKWLEEFHAEIQHRARISSPEAGGNTAPAPSVIETEARTVSARPTRPATDWEAPQGI